jgi:hypothetical protein
MQPLPVYEVEAFNVSREAENKIHDDDVARRFGFRGGLVPGAEVYAYMTHLPLARWRREWLARGAAECKFLKPVYDGVLARVTVTDDDGGVISIQVESGGESCATGTARLADGPPAPLEVPRVKSPPAASARPRLAAGTWLATNPLAVTADFHSQYLRDVREREALFTDATFVHPGLYLRLCNALLRENVALGPWIHVGSTVHHCAPAAVGSVLAARGCVVANYERKGHRFVEVDAMVSADDTPVARVRHIAIYRPRQAMEAA